MPNFARLDPPPPRKIRGGMGKLSENSNDGYSLSVRFFSRLKFFPLSAASTSPTGLTSRNYAFYRAALNAVRSSREKSVCPSVRLSVKRVDCDKTEEDLSRFLYHTKDHLAFFLRKRMVGGGDPFYLKFLVQLTALERNRRFSIHFRP